MPNKTIYVSNENLPLYEAVSNDTEASLSVLFAEFLRGRTGNVNSRTLRDEFAMSAMTGLAARDYRMGKSDQAEVVKIAYAIADQMIETRKK